MKTTQYLGEILKELSRTVDLISDEEAEKLVDKILESKKIFVAGAGRSGFMAKSFAMRMMHMGLDAYVIGETVTPNYEKEDLLIIGSGSGETKSLVSMAEKAQKIGGSIAAATIFPESTIGQLADITVKLLFRDRKWFLERFAVSFCRIVFIFYSYNEAILLPSLSPFFSLEEDDKKKHAFLF
ncbi:6-phospho-3-hexuloisomerase [Bacillus smithii]|uniref:6-phospho-3-hexuloisomerase n=1 Tax=Bacillus smithii TaxID=1479 RepID=UPI0022E4560C|nr:6-phospho-3-hexuloisomerase [Bacillus smithii]